MKKETSLLEEQVNIYNDFIKNSPSPVGLIEFSITNNISFILKSASDTFFNISGHTSRKDIDAIPVFSKFKGATFSFFEAFIKNSSKIQAQLFCPLNGSFLKISLKKINQTHFSFSIEDITQFHQQRIELADKKRQLKESQEIAHLGFWVESHKKQKHIWSDQVYKILETEKQFIEPCFENYLSFVHPDDKLIVKSNFEESINNRTGYSISHRLLLKNGIIKYVIQRCYTDYDANGNPLQSVGIIQDITPYEKTKNQLQKSEAIFRSVFEDAPIAIVLVNNKLKPVFSNNQFSDITGYSMKEIIQKEVKDFTYSEDYEHNKQQYEKLFNGEINSFSITKRYLKKNTDLIWVKVTVSSIRGLPNEGDYAIAMVQDISSEKKATEALIKSEYKYRTLIESANDGIGLFDLDFKPITFNTVLYEMLGYTREEYLTIDHSKFELFHPDDIKYAKKALEKLGKNIRTKIENRLRAKSGEYIYCSISYIPVVHENKPAILIFRRDISKRKNAEFQNQEYRMFLETIMDNLPVSFFAKTTPDFRYLYWNKTIEKTTGISGENAIGKTDFELLQFKSLAEQYHEEDLQLLKNKRKLESEHRFTNYAGETKHLRTIKALHQSTTGNPLILGLSLDITELKEAQNQIEQSTQMLKEAQKIAKLGYWEYDVKKDLFFDNIENRQILGTENVPYFLNARQFKELIIPADQDMVDKSFMNCINKKQPGEGIIRISAQNEIKHISINYKPVEDENGKVHKLRGICLDISRIRRSEISLRESENRLKQAEHIAKVGYWNYDYESNHTQFSDEVWNILERSPRNKQIRFTEFLNAVHSDDKLSVADQFNKSKKSNQPFDFEFRIVTHNQNIKHIKAIGTFVKNQDKSVVKSIGTFQDITDSKENEIALLKSNSQLFEIQKMAKIGFLECEIKGSVTYLSNTLLTILEPNKTNNPKNLNDFHSFIHEEDRKTIILTFEKAAKEREAYNIQYRIKTGKNNIRFVHEICNFNVETRTNKVFARRIIQDITELKEKEAELNKISLINESLLMGTFSLNIDTYSIVLSKGLQNKLSLPETTNLSEFIKLINPQEKSMVENTIKNSISTQRDFSISCWLVLQNPELSHYINLSAKFNNADYKILSITIKDITDVKNVVCEPHNTSELFLEFDTLNNYVSHNEKDRK